MKSYNGDLKSKNNLTETLAKAKVFNSKLSFTKLNYKKTL